MARTGLYVSLFNVGRSRLCRAAARYGPVVYDEDRPKVSFSPSGNTKFA